MPVIDPLAVVQPGASIGPGVEVGPFAVIEAGAVVGPGCTIASRAVVKSGVTLGADNTVAEGAVLGGVPQHLQHIESPGPLTIGDRNIIRENVTLHRAMTATGETRVGSDCLLMVASHVAHDCVIGNRVVLTNNVMLAGHVTIGDRAYLGGGAAVHQHCRIGRVAMVGGMARVTQDIPPFVTIDGGTGSVVGLNKVGLRRAGLGLEEVRQVKAAYQIIYRSGLPLEGRLAALDAAFAAGPAADFAPFFRGGDRGFARERRMPPGATLRVLRDGVDETAAEARRAG
ncbi:MAG: acyl-ACP--UDP-N-acetylglucosamine O-acyltransferase [Planctomycetota bacterium]